MIAITITNLIILIKLIEIYNHFQYQLYYTCLIAV